MKKTALLLLPILCSLISCGADSSGGESSLQTPGEYVTFNASSLPSSPKKIEYSVTIEGHVFTYYNVYKDSENNFVLKGKDSYIQNYDITFGLRFSSKLAVAYDLSEGNVGTSRCEIYYETNNTIAYTVNNGFEIRVDPSLTDGYDDVNIGKIEHWC